MKYWQYAVVALSITATLGAVFCSVPAALGHSLLSLAQIIGEVTLICVGVGILEYRSWLRWGALAARPLMRFSRLPESCGLAFVAAFGSGSVASLMLADERRAGRITRREMILGALCNSTSSVFSFSFWISLPVIGILGWAGIVYYGISYLILLILLLGFLFYARVTARGVAAEFRNQPPEVLPWPEVWRKTAKRTWRFLGRMLLLTMPFYLWTACAVQRGFFQFSVPAGWEKYLTPEALSVLAARVGGMLSASGTAAELLRQNRISVGQLVLVLLIGNVMNGLIRMLRRGLPVSLGIYPGYDGAIIATVSVGGRVILTLLAIIILWKVL